MAAVYNMPLPEQKKKVRFKIKEKMRVPIVDQEEYQKSSIGGRKLLEAGNQYQNW